jgi:hypothetical protein
MSREQPMQSETGESSASINKRSDREAWPAVLSALRDGAVLRVHHKIRRVAVEGIQSRDPRSGRTISYSFTRRLEREGVIEPCGVDRYQLTGARA